MHTPTDNLLIIFKHVLSLYARNYFNLYGVPPAGADLTKMVYSTFDVIDDPKVRSQLRKSLKIMNLKIDGEKCQIQYAVETKAVKFLNRYLSKE